MMTAKIRNSGPLGMMPQAMDPIPRIGAMRPDDPRLLAVPLSFPVVSYAVAPIASPVDITATETHLLPEWLDLREAIRRGSESHRPYTLRCAIMDAQITHDPQKQIAVGTVTVISGYVWRKVSVFQDVYAAMINSFTGLFEAKWQVIIA